MDMDDMPGMDMDGTTTTMGTMGMMLGFHAMPFDQLWFSGWTPLTNGAMVGACVGIFLLAIVDRWVAAIRGLCEVWWKMRTDAILARKYANSASSVLPIVGSQPTNNEKKSASASEVDVEDCCSPSTPSVPIPALSYRPLPPPFPTRLSAIDRLIPPFIFSHDVPRGVLQVAQAALGYALMLAFMTMNWGYCLSVLAGLGVGEVLFGRYANHGGQHGMTGSA